MKLCLAFSNKKSESILFPFLGGSQLAKTKEVHAGYFTNLFYKENEKGNKHKQLSIDNCMRNI